MKLLENKVAVVTGVNSGIGRRTAELFAEHGAKIVGVDVRTDRMEELEAKVKSFGTEFVGCQCDVRDDESVQNVFKQAVKSFGRIDIVANIAGVSSDRPLTRTTGEEFSRVMDINVKGVFNFCKYATPYFKKQKSGVIINTSSVTGIFGSVMGCPYPTSKAAIIGLTKSLAIELAPWKIRVNAVAPGVVNTEMVAVLNEQERKTFTNSIPLKRMGEAEDISYAMLYLASDWASYVTGITIQVDGGYRPSNVNM
jgi:NAD(P)-dependent dehydrogenase (short-subunit alcohol dehydrogenase family)